MALTVIFPSEVTIDGEAIKNKQVALNNGLVTVTLYAQVFNTNTSAVIAEQGFTVSGDKTHGDVYVEAVRDLAKDIDEWSDNVRAAVNLRQNALANLETDVAALLTT